MSQLGQVVVRIREMILQGELAPGQRVPEAVLAEQLGLSRTPVRQALPLLAQEGLLVDAGARGYAVRGFTAQDILEATELRGMLEGAAARAIAERGPKRALLRTLTALLDEGDELLGGTLSDTDETAYAAMNGRFHEAIVEECEQPLLQELIGRVQRVPFAAPTAIAFDRSDLRRTQDDLWFAHRQHHFIVQALEAGEGARVEALLREHVRIQRHSLNLRPHLAAPVDA
jgi:GntR family transcriptional regulator, vanillate catabolism transcriptional regulator